MEILTEEQYNILSQQKAAFVELETSQTARGLPRKWLQQMDRIHQDIFNQDVCLTCASRIAAAMNRLHKKMKEYESEADSGKPGPKNRGRRNNGQASGGGTEAQG